MRRLSAYRLALPLAFGIAAVSAAGIHAQGRKSAESATTPAPRDGGWVKMHERFLDEAKSGKIDLLFLGDSITEGWFGEDGKGGGPKAVWNRQYGPRHAANFGIGGDRTQHVLWRLQHGEVDGIKPKVVVLMIGTNNVGSDPPNDIAEGVTAIVKTLRAKLPESKVLLLAVFPRGRTPDANRDRLKSVNLRIKKLDDGKTVKYLDIGDTFMNEDGSISKAIMPDYLHLSGKGYRLWADSIEPTLRDMLGEG